MADQKNQRSSNSGANAGLRKRQQIASSNKVMFMWVAAASVLAAFALVISVFIIKQIVFTERVLIEKNNTIGTLNDNLENAKGLDKNVSKLRANRDLTVSRSNASDNNLDVIIDAMPYAAEDAAFGSSLQNKILNDVSLDSLSIGNDDVSSDTEVVEADEVGDALSIKFSFRITGSTEQVKDALNKLNRSIRPIVVTSLQVESAGGGNVSANVQAVTYYQPAKKLELSEKVVKP